MPVPTLFAHFRRGPSYTGVPGAKTAAEFLAGIRAGRAVVHGANGSYLELTLDVYRIAKALFSEKPWTLPILPITALVPAFTAAHWINEIRFCMKWSAFLEEREGTPRRSGKPRGTLRRIWAGGPRTATNASVLRAAGGRAQGTVPV